MLGVSRCCVLSGPLILFGVFFLLIPILYLLVLLGILSDLGLCVATLGRIFRGVSVIIVCILRAFYFI